MHFTVQHGETITFALYIVFSPVVTKFSTLFHGSHCNQVPYTSHALVAGWLCSNWQNKRKARSQEMRLEDCPEDEEHRL